MTNKTNKTYKIEKTSNEEFPLNVKILINGFYCGNGRFCKNKDEAIEYINSDKFDRVVELFDTFETVSKSKKLELGECSIQIDALNNTIKINMATPLGKILNVYHEIVISNIILNDLINLNNLSREETLKEFINKFNDEMENFDYDKYIEDLRNSSIWDSDVIYESDNIQYTLNTDVEDDADNLSEFMEYISDKLKELLNY